MDFWQAIDEVRGFGIENPAELVTTAEIFGIAVAESNGLKVEYDGEFTVVPT